MEPYRYVARSVTGFVQQVVSSYVRHGYYFFVAGRVPVGKNAAVVDGKLLDKYGIAMGSGQRYHRKRRGLANLQYIRFEDEFLMLATRGRHVWFDEERGNIRDVRKVPIHFRGYSIRLRPGNFAKKEREQTKARRDGQPRVRVLIGRKRYGQLKAQILALARERETNRLAVVFRQVPFEPYAPIRKQLLGLLRQANAVRRRAGYEQLSSDVIRYRRQIVKPFG